MTLLALLAVAVLLASAVYVARLPDPLDNDGRERADARFVAGVSFHLSTTTPERQHDHVG